MKTVPLDQLSFDSFAKLVNTKFRVGIAANESVELELIEATPPRTSFASRHEGPIFETFSLVFVGPGERVLPQRSYPFEYDRAGRFELFITRVAQSTRGAQKQIPISTNRQFTEFGSTVHVSRTQDTRCAID